MSENILIDALLINSRKKVDEKEEEYISPVERLKNPMSNKESLWPDHDSRDSLGLVNNTPKNLVIICNPNGSPLEFYSQSDRIIDFYLKLNTSVLLWNYRGYGESTGSISLSVRIRVKL